jgi:hypothetical protein
MSLADVFADVFGSDRDGRAPRNAEIVSQTDRHELFDPAVNSVRLVIEG